MKHLYLAALLLLALPAPADAHAFLHHAEPGVGSTVKAAPSQLVLDFTEGVEPAFCTVAVTDAAGNRVDAAAPKPSADDARRLIVPLKPLAPGTYTVNWHATSVDTHKTEGTFRFTVAP
jgi:copper resistance protein C